MKKSRKIFVRAVCIVLAVLMALSVLCMVISSYAVSQAEIDRLQERKEALAAQAKEMQEYIDRLERDQARYIDRKAALDMQIINNAAEIDVILEEIQLYDEQVEETRLQLEEATSSERQQFEQLRLRMRAMEEHGTLSYIAVLFNATSLTDLLAKASDISGIMLYDRELQEEYVSAREDVATLTAQLEDTLARQEAIKAELEFKQRQVEAQTVAAYEMIAALEDDVDAYNKAYEENEAEAKALQAEIDQMLKDLQAQEAAAAAAAVAAAAAAAADGEDDEESGGNTGSAGTSVSATGDLAWPSSTYLVTSEYGWRIHPIQGTNRFHAGVDIGASAGSAVTAAAAGTVVTATYNDSYGNYVLISHGNGMATLYAHMSSMTVSAGDTVTQRQLIGYVGSTGWATAPHLHFEVRVNGSTVDPLHYFSGYTIYNG